MNNDSLIKQYGIKKGLNNELKKPVILIDCMDTIVYRDCSLNGILKRWANSTGKDFGLYPKYLYGYRTKVVLGAMHNTVPIETVYGELFDQSAYFGLIDASLREKFIITAHRNELNCELQSQKVIEKTKQFLLEQYDNGVLIYCVSDFRLPAQDIMHFFQQQKIDHVFSGIFSSCEAGVTKKEGQFYSHVLSKINVSPKDCIMIGDNFSVDCVNAATHGISACWAVNIK